MIIILHICISILLIIYKPAFALACLLRADLALAILKRAKSLFEARFFFAANFFAQLVPFHLFITVSVEIDSIVSML